MATALEQFASNLRFIRTARKLSRKKLAERADLDHGTVCLIERGLNHPRLGTVVALARGLEVPTAELVQHL
ncbi:MAG: helix-turn-helix transcriptional regulator [Verrucomicrobia bacterium]|nr:helix-turn-helix transcriptional regulator [Verrucomicrobiota bacterium]